MPLLIWRQYAVSMFAVPPYMPMQCLLSGAMASAPRSYYHIDNPEKLRAEVVKECHTKITGIDTSISSGAKRVTVVRCAQLKHCGVLCVGEILQQGKTQDQLSQFQSFN